MRQAISYGDRLPGASSRRCRARPSRPAAWSRPACSATSPTCRTTPTTRPRRRQLLNQAGYGPGKKPLNLTLTYTQGDSNEQVVATLLKSSLAKLNINLSTQSLAWPTQWAKAQVRQRGQPPEHLPRVLVAGLRRPVHLVHQPAADREAAVLQPVLLLQPGAGQADQPGRAAARDQPRSRRAAVPGPCRSRSCSRRRSTSLYNVNYQYAMRNDVHRLPGQPGLRERGLRLQPQADRQLTATTSRAGSPWPSLVVAGVIVADVRDRPRGPG